MSTAIPRERRRKENALERSQRVRTPFRVLQAAQNEKESVLLRYRDLSVDITHLSVDRVSSAVGRRKETEESDEVSDETAARLGATERRYLQEHWRREQEYG